MQKVAFYILTYDGKSPVFYGPYGSNEQALGKQAKLTFRGELLEYPTNDRSRAIRMAKAEMDEGLVSFKHGKD